MRIKYIKHKKVPVQSYGYINSDDCPCKDMFAHYLWMAAPEIKLIHVEDVGSYQGTVFAIGRYKNKWFIMKDYYGSCSGCGAWGEGGELESLKSVLNNGELFTSKQKAYEFVTKTYLSDSSYERPTNEFINILCTK